MLSNLLVASEVTIKFFVLYTAAVFRNEKSSVFSPENIQRTLVIQEDRIFLNNQNHIQ